MGIQLGTHTDTLAGHWDVPAVTGSIYKRFDREHFSSGGTAKGVGPLGTSMPAAFGKGIGPSWKGRGCSRANVAKVIRVTTAQND